MAESDERRKILDLLAAGKVSVEQATELLKAVGAGEQAMPPPRGIAKVLRIDIDSHDGDGRARGKVSVTVPLGLVKFAGKFLPQEARGQLDRHGIDLAALLASLDADTPPGPLLDIDASDDESGSGAKITIEVV